MTAQPGGATGRYDLTAEAGGAASPLPWAAEVPDSSRRMIEAAIAAFADRGYHATTTRDIATRANLSPAALYVHFPSKSALLGTISTLGHQAAYRLLAGALQRDDDPVEALRAAIRDFAGWHARHHRVARVVQYELSALPEPDRRQVLATRRAIEGLVEDQLRAGVAAGVMAVDDEHAVARALLSLCVDVARWYDPRGTRSPDEIGRLYGDLAVRMVRA